MGRKGSMSKFKYVYYGVDKINPFFHNIYNKTHYLSHSHIQVHFVLFIMFNIIITSLTNPFFTRFLPKKTTVDEIFMNEQ